MQSSVEAVSKSAGMVYESSHNHTLHNFYIIVTQGKKVLDPRKLLIVSFKDLADFLNPVVLLVVPSWNEAQTLT